MEIAEASVYKCSACHLVYAYAEDCRACESRHSVESVIIHFDYWTSEGVKKLKQQVFFYPGQMVSSTHFTIEPPDEAFYTVDISLQMLPRSGSK